MSPAAQQNISKASYGGGTLLLNPTDEAKYPVIELWYQIFQPGTGSWTSSADSFLQTAAPTNIQNVSFLSRATNTDDDSSVL